MCTFNSIDIADCPRRSTYVAWRTDVIVVLDGLYLATSKDLTGFAINIRLRPEVTWKSRIGKRVR